MRIAWLLTCFLVLPIVGQDLDDFRLDEPVGLASMSGDERAREVRRLLQNPTAEDSTDLGVIITSNVESLEQARTAFEHLLRLGGAERAVVGRKALDMIVPEYRMMGVMLIGASGDRTALPRLLALARTEKDALVRFGLTIAFGQLGTAEVQPFLRDWSAEDPVARLALCLTGDYERLEQTLADVGETKQELQLLLHEITLASAYGWSPGQVANARQQVQRYNHYLALVPRLLRSLKPAQIKVLTGFLQASATSEVANVLFVQAPEILTTDNLQAFLPLVHGDNLELAEQLARVMAREFPAKQSTLTTHLDSLDQTSVRNRVLRLRLADILPDEARQKRVETALNDASEWVVIEALNGLTPNEAATFRNTLSALSARWQDNPRVRLALQKRGAGAWSGTENH